MFCPIMWFWDENINSNYGQIVLGIHILNIKWKYFRDEMIIVAYTFPWYMSLYLANCTTKFRFEIHIYEAESDEELKWYF